MPLPTATEEEEEDIYIGPTDYVSMPSGPAPKPVERKTTKVKRDLASKVVVHANASVTNILLSKTLVNYGTVVTTNDETPNS